MYVIIQHRGLHVGTAPNPLSAQCYSVRIFPYRVNKRTCVQFESIAEFVARNTGTTRVLCCKEMYTDACNTVNVMYTCALLYILP